MPCWPSWSWATSSSSTVFYRMSLIKNHLLKQAICCKHTLKCLHNNLRSRTVCQISHTLLLATWNNHQPQVHTYAHCDLQKSACHLCQGLANARVVSSFNYYHSLWLISPITWSFKPDYQPRICIELLLFICCGDRHAFHPTSQHERFMVLTLHIIVNSHSLQSIAFFHWKQDESPELLIIWPVRKQTIIMVF